MPIVLKEGPYRFFFYSADRDEPKHIHVTRDSHVSEILAGSSENAEKWRTKAVGNSPSAKDH